ncbi:muscular LMNA-interacting protein isoform X49 [Peromyscus leucopus]|uniref:muscular LMNA-interacting protein isoform X49 n=1 Tax=Peromyscus leucopus TaxID=10041 RepID=UPI0010A1E89D|nr:muscular LMNA-interacting protein isoform X49 [Peromyscus leucopus]
MELEKHEPGSSLEKNQNLVERVTCEYSGHMTFSCDSQQERDQRILAYPSEVSGRNSQGKKFDTNEPQGMQKGDLFKAEYVFIVDSDGEDEATSRQSEQGTLGGTGNIATRPKSLAISSSLASDVVRPKVRDVDLKASTYPKIPHGMAPQQKHGQQYKTKSSYKAFAAIPTNTLLLEQKTPTTHPRAAGRETKYANLLSSSSTASESQLTKPGVIRPVPVKSKLLLRKEEEVYEPNPFSKYLEDNSSLFSEQ